MKHLSKAAGDVSKKIFQKKYVVLGRLLDQWVDIVGERFAYNCSPSRLSFRKNPKNPKKPFTVLSIAVSSAYATILHYQKDVILQRINQVFGDDMIADIKFVPQKSNQNTTGEKSKALKAPDISEKNLAIVAESLRVIEDPDMKARLESLGKLIYRS